MSGMIELLFLQPPQVPHRPALLAREDTTVLEHEGAHLLPMNSKRLDRCSTAANEVTHRLVTFVRHPYRGKLTGPQKLG